MPNPYPTTLRERAVRACETSTETYADIGARFSIGLNTLPRWVQRARATGDVSPFDNWGDNLPLVGAIRVDRLPTLATSWDAMNTAHFHVWVRPHPVRHLRRGDVMVMDNSRDPWVRRPARRGQCSGAACRHSR
jgi:hypothetical protein